MKGGGFGISSILQQQLAETGPVLKILRIKATSQKMMVNLTEPIAAVNNWEELLGFIADEL